jgi:uncharacterized protein YbjT (DUF2867 family)
MSMSILVAGATGKQGGAVARALLAAGTPVRALVRDPHTESAKVLADLGADLVRGDLYDRESLVAAASGVRGVFSVQTPDLADLGSDSEQVHGRNLVEAARTAGVEQLVQTSVSGAGQHRTAPGWAEGRWDRHYWESKAATDELVRAAGFTHWTVLKPATFMENLVGWSPMFGSWTSNDTLVTTFAPTTVLPLIAVEDIGTAAAAAFADPTRFDGQDLELAGDLLTMTEIAGVLSEVLGRPIAAPVLAADEAIERGMMPVMVGSMEWMNVVGSPARPTHAKAFGLAVTNFRTWARRTFGD